MSFVHTFNQGWSRSGALITASVDITVEEEVTLDVTLTASQTNKEKDVTLDVSQLKAVHILSTVNCVIKTNSTSAPDDTITLVAGEPLAWHYLMPKPGGFVSAPLTVDVTKFYVTNSEAVVGSVSFRIGLNPAP